METSTEDIEEVSCIIGRKILVVVDELEYNGFGVVWVGRESASDDLHVLLHIDG